jgi:hypothetical protein
MLLRVAIAIAIMALSKSSMAQAGYREWQIKSMRGQDSISLAIDFNEQRSQRCSISLETVRSTIVNRLAQYGISISRDAELTYNIGILIMDASINNNVVGCVVSISSIIFDYKFYRDSSSNLEFGRISNYDNHRLSISGTSDFSRKTTDFVLDEINAFLSIWNEANPGRARALLPPSNNQNPNLRTVQQRLSDLGLYRGTVDGITGPGTRNAIQQFQRQNNLPATGDLDDRTMRLMFP